jgi:hypothetical protein
MTIRSSKSVLSLIVGLVLGATGAAIIRSASAMPPAEVDTLRREEVEAMRELVRETARVREVLRDHSAITEVAREVGRLREAVANCQRR